MQRHLGSFASKAGEKSGLVAFNYGFFAPYDAPTNPVIPSPVGAARAANLLNIRISMRGKFETKFGIFDEAPDEAPDKVWGS